MYVSSPAFFALILCHDHTSFPALRIALHVLIPSQFYSPVVPGLDCLDHPVSVRIYVSTWHLDGVIFTWTITLPGKQSHTIALYETQKTSLPQAVGLFPRRWVAQRKYLHMHWICDTTMFIQNGKPGDFRTQTNIFMASLSTTDPVWFVHDEQFLKRICGTITTREIYTHPSVFFLVSKHAKNSEANLKQPQPKIKVILVSLLLFMHVHLYYSTLLFKLFINIYWTMHCLQYSLFAICI